MKLKRPIMYKITMVLQIGWIIIVVADVMAMSLFSSPVFAFELGGGECKQIIGLGYGIAVFYPLTTMDDPVQSTTHINAYGLLFGQIILTVMNAAQGRRFIKHKRESSKHQ